MKPRILLVNPPIYDFSAYDFWLKPYGMLRVAGFLRGRADFFLFDFMDRLDARVPAGRYRADPWGRGEYYSEPAPKPLPYRDVRRQFRRFGLRREEFQSFLKYQGPFDHAFIQTGMTYWYLGVREVIKELRASWPQTKIVLGGVYATLCASHARSLGADLVIEGLDLAPLWPFLRLSPDKNRPPLWDLYPRLKTAVVKLADGCPFRCTYCSVPQVYPAFEARPLHRSLAELEFLIGLGAENIAFYDDALLYRSDQILKPFLLEVLRRNLHVNFHTPNALNARFISRELAEVMVASGFNHFYLGFESSAYAWQKKTGGKVYALELERAVKNLLDAGADPELIYAYIIVGHPDGNEQAVDESIRFASDLGIRVMLSEFSPIPGTPDGEACRGTLDLDEPLWHNKTFFAIHRLGDGEVNRLKNLVSRLNRRRRGLSDRLPTAAAGPGADPAG